MNTKLTKQALAIALALSIPAVSAQAQVNDATFKCQKIIEKSVEKFVDKVADAIEKCLLAVQKCNTEVDPSDVAACKAKLLVIGKGACASGKLAPDYQYMGVGSSANYEPEGKSVVEKNYGKLRGALQKCDLPSVDFAALGLPVPADLDALVDSLNTNPNGAACLANKRVKVTVPNRDTLWADLSSQPDGANTPLPLANIFNPPFGNCK